jgi:hypothetical protein
MTTKYITDVLKELNNDLSLFQTTYKKQGNGGPLGKLFFHAYVPNGKFILPSGIPPFKKALEPQGLTGVPFIAQIGKFDIFCKKDIPMMKREDAFIRMCEVLHPDEVAILIAVKDQTLPHLYPKLTYKVIAEAGFIPMVDNPPEVPPLEEKPLTRYQKLKMRRLARQQELEQKAAAEKAASNTI